MAKAWEYRPAALCSNAVLTRTSDPSLCVLRASGTESDGAFTVEGGSLERLPGNSFRKKCTRKLLAAQQLT